MTKPQFKSAFDLFEPSIRIIRDNLVPYFVLLVLPGILVTIGQVSIYESGPNIVRLLGGLLTIALLPPLTKLYIHTSKGQIMTLQQAFDGSYRYFWRLLGLVLLTGLIIIGGLLLFIIPGFIFMRRYILAPFYLVEKDMKIWAAMELSAAQTKPHSWRIYDIIAVTFLIVVFGIVGPVGAAISAVLGMIYSLAIPIRYQEIKKASH